MEVNYRYNSKNENVIKNIINFILEKEYGSLVYYNEIAQRIGLNLEFEEHIKLFKRLMSKVKNVLIDYGYILKSIGGKAYYILKQNQIASFTYRNYIIKPQRAYEKAKRILERTRKNEFTKLDEEEHDNVTILNNQMIEVSDYTIFNSEYYQNKDKYKENEYDKDFKRKKN